MKKEYITKSAEGTQRIAIAFAKKISHGGVVALSGDLGFGKTTFVQGVAKGLGIERRIISPTFVIMRKYEIKNQTIHPKDDQPLTKNDTDKKLKIFYHIDLYRMETVQDIHGVGIEEMLGDVNAIILIEWPEKVNEMLPKKRWEVRFEFLHTSERKITIEKIED